MKSLHWLTSFRVDINRFSQCVREHCSICLVHLMFYKKYFPGKDGRKEKDGEESADKSLC